MLYPSCWREIDTEYSSCGQSPTTFGITQCNAYTGDETAVRTHFMIIAHADDITITRPTAAHATPTTVHGRIHDHHSTHPHNILTTHPQSTYTVHTGHKAKQRLSRWPTCSEERRTGRVASSPTTAE